MTENDGMASQSVEPVQKSKLPILLVVLEIIGIILVIFCIFCRIEAVGATVVEFLNLGISTRTLTMIILGIVIVILLVSAFLEYMLKKKNMISKSIQKTFTVLNFVMIILVFINLISGWFMFR